MSETHLSSPLSALADLDELVSVLAALDSRVEPGLRPPVKTIAAW